jgi:hypothetical protein
MPIIIDIYAKLHERSLKRDTDKLEREAQKTGLRAGKKLGDSIEQGMGKSSLRSEKAMDRLAGTMAKVKREQEELNRMMKDGESNSRRLITQQERLNSAYQKQQDAIRSLGRAMRDSSSNAQQAEGTISGLRKQIQNLGTSAFLTTRGLGTLAVIPLIPAMVELGHVVVGATKSIALLPAVASTAAAGMGTLALATSGFADTIKDIRDPEKFAAAIQGLAPSAQQAALSIQNLLPEFDKLKAATQEAFFKGIGEEIHNLANQYLPTIQNMTTSIATSFNNMMKGVGAQLMTTETQGAIQNLTTNISTFFDRITPAAGKLADAFFNIASTGSDFLPGFAENIAKAASDFANFINQAQQSGQLKQWIQEGIDSVAALADVLKDVTVLIYETFGTDTEYSIRRMKATMEEVVNTLKILIITFDLATGHTASLVNETKKLDGWPGKFRDALMDIPEAFATVGNVVIGFFDRIAERLTNVINGPLKWISSIAERLGLGDPNLHVSNDLLNARIPVGDWAGGGRPNTVLGGLAEAAGQNRVLGGLAEAGLGPYRERDVPPKPPEKGQKPPLNIPRELFSLENIPLGAFGGSEFAAGTGPGMAPGPGPGPGGIGPWMMKPGEYPGAPGEIGRYETDQGKIYDAETRLYNAQGSVEEARLRVLELRADGNSDQNDIETAQRNVVERERAYIAATRELAEAQQGTWKKMEKNANTFADGMQKVGIALDEDFGISEGLPGIAENLVKFLAGLAAAPVIGKLTGITASLGTAGTGSGLLGMLAPRENMFGQAFPNIRGQYPMPGQYPTSGQYPAASNMGPTALRPSIPQNIGMPSILKDTGSIASGPQSRFTAAVIEQLWGDQIRGKIGGSRDTNTAKNTHDIGRSIDIPIGSDQMALGDEINAYLQSHASELGLKYSIWRNQGKYPGGGGFGASGHMDHIDANFNGSPLAGATSPLISGLSANTSALSANTSALSSKQQVADYIAQKAAAAGYTPAQSQAFIAQGLGESGLNPAAYGATTGNASGGASGIFQFTPDTWTDFGQGGNPMNARENVDAYFRLAQARDPGTGNIRSRIGAISGGGPAVPSNNAPWDDYMQQAGGLMSGGSGAPVSAGRPLYGPPIPGEGGGIGTGGVGSGAGFPGLAAPPAAHGPRLGGLGGFTDPGTAQPGRYPGEGLNLPGGKGGIGASGGGLIGVAQGAIQSGIAAAGMAGDVAGGGGGGSAAAAVAAAFAQIGIDELNRAIEFGSQAIGIGVGGLMETFLPNESPLADVGNSWFGRIAGAVAGIAPASANIAGQLSQQLLGQQTGESPPPLTPEQVAAQEQAGQGTGPAPGPNINLNVNNNRATEDQNGKAITQHLESMYRNQKR